MASEGAWHDAATALLVVGAFVLGAASGTLVSERAGKEPFLALLSTELGLLLAGIAVAVLVAPAPALVIVAVAMGLQNAIHQSIAGADVGKSFITGTLYGLGDSLARFLTRKGDGRRVLVFALSWSAFVGGVMVGSVTLAWLGLIPSLTIAACGLSVVILLRVLRTL